MEISNRLDGKYTVDEIKGFLANKFSCPQEILDTLEEIKSSYKLITINDILKLFKILISVASICAKSASFSASDNSS